MINNFSQNEDSPPELLTLFESIEEISECIYHKRSNRIQIIPEQLLIIEKILKKHPEYIFQKKDGVRLTGTWSYCNQISPLELALLQNYDDTWKYIINIVLHVPHKKEMEQKLLNAFKELQEKEIPMLDCEDYYLKFSEIVGRFAQHDDPVKMCSDVLGMEPPKKSSTNLHLIKHNQFNKKHSKPAFLSHPIKWLKGNTFESEYRTWCANVKESIVHSQNEEKKVLSL